MPASLSGPRLPAKSGKTRSLVVLLHGYGADGNDLIEIGRSWRDWLPDAAFVAPHAPEACLSSPSGRQWFPLTMRDPHERWRGVTGAHDAVNAFLDAELASFGLKDTALALVGFSQGTMVALHTGLRRTRAPAAILGYSGTLVINSKRAKDPGLEPDATARPPVLLVHGEADDVIPADALFMSSDVLADSGVPCQWHLSLQTGHGIDPQGLTQGGLFLARNFGLKDPRRLKA